MTKEGVIAMRNALAAQGEFGCVTLWIGPDAWKLLFGEDWLPRDSSPVFHAAGGNVAIKGYRRFKRGETRIVSADGERILDWPDP